VIRSLQCDVQVSAGYKSPAQISRVVTEHWCSINLYCAGCDSESLAQTPTNTKAVDFYCPQCRQSYQLKSHRHSSLKRVTDGSYASMIAAVQQNAAPNLLILNYGFEWEIRKLLLIPSLFFTESVLEKRPPLREHARRAGWVGCNLLLSNVPAEGKIPLILGNKIVPPAIVRKKFQQHQNLKNIEWHARGWTLDVLRIARSLGQSFKLQDVYQRESELMRLHPANRNIRAKIRQQLQVLRDLGHLDFLGKGSYRFKEY
jgi:type II restriction enzyme